MSCQVGTIRQIHQRLQAEGFLVSEYALRQWVKSGKLSAVFVGNKALISYGKVLEILGHGTLLNPIEHQQPNARPDR